MENSTFPQKAWHVLWSVEKNTLSTYEGKYDNFDKLLVSRYIVLFLQKLVCILGIHVKLYLQIIIWVPETYLMYQNGIHTFSISLLYLKFVMLLARKKFNLLDKSVLCIFWTTHVINTARVI